MEALGKHLLVRHIDDFLTDLANANKSGHTVRAYRGDLIASPPITTARSAS